MELNRRLGLGPNAGRPSGHVAPRGVLQEKEPEDDRYMLDFADWADANVSMPEFPDEGFDLSGLTPDSPRPMAAAAAAYIGGAAAREAVAQLGNYLTNGGMAGPNPEYYEGPSPYQLPEHALGRLNAAEIDDRDFIGPRLPYGHIHSSYVPTRKRKRFSGRRRSTYRRRYTRRAYPRRTRRYRRRRMYARFGNGARARGTYSRGRTYRGYGDYHVSKNTLKPGLAPYVLNSALPGGANIISFKEYLGEVVSSDTPGAFKLDSYRLNPGDSKTFPWLSQIATNFQEYQFRGLVFTYRTMSADALNSTNTALGQVIMATNYDASQPNFSSKAEMENSAYSQSVKPSCTMEHLIECAPRASVLSELYVAAEPPTSNADIRFTDFGVFQIATNGLQAASVDLGELWVSYEVALIKPKIYDTISSNVRVAKFFGTTGVTNADPFGSFTNFSYNTLDCTKGLRSITYPATSYKRRYYLFMVWDGGAVAVVNPTVTVVGGTLIGQLATPNATTTTIPFKYLIIETSGDGVTDVSVQLGSAGTLPTGSQVTLFTSEEPMIFG